MNGWKRRLRTRVDGPKSGRMKGPLSISPSLLPIIIVAFTQPFPQVARAAAIAEDQAQNLTSMDGNTLPPGWSGKLWAMQQGIEQAGKTAPDFFLFTDADIEHSPGNLAQLIAQAERGSYDLVSLMVKLRSW